MHTNTYLGQRLLIKYTPKTPKKGIKHYSLAYIRSTSRNKNFKSIQNPYKRREAGTHETTEPQKQSKSGYV